MQFDELEPMKVAYGQSVTVLQLHGMRSRLQCERVLTRHS